MPSAAVLNGARARLQCWGARGTCPSPGAHSVRYGGHTACMFVQMADGVRMILDAGTGLRALGRSLLQRGPSAEGRPVVLPLLMSHRHSDHVIGLPHFAPLRAGTHVLRIACWSVDEPSLSQFITQQLTAPLFPTLDGVEDSVSILNFDERDQLVMGEHTRVYALPAHHPGGAAVMRIDDARGPVIAYAPDNELAYYADTGALAIWRRSLGTALRGTPLLLHDATYTDAELSAHRDWGHSSAEEATRFAIEYEIGTLLLMHHHPDRTDDEIDAIVERCRAIVKDARSPLVVQAAAEGMDVGVPGSGY